MFDMLGSFCLGTMYDFEDKINAPRVHRKIFSSY